jgi:anti-sigma regulatory factor (Ser/Thr protein kinase)
MGTVEGVAVGVPGRASAVPGPRTCIRSFRASPDQVGEARRFLAQVLGDCLTATDAVACLSEIVTNSALYSNSRRPGGRFIVRASLRPAGLRVEDEGGPWQLRHGHSDQRARGLAIVDALSADWSVSGDGTSRTVWFEIGEDAPPASNFTEFALKDLHGPHITDFGHDHVRYEMVWPAKIRDTSTRARLEGR